MTETVIGHSASTVSNIVKPTINKVAKEATQRTFEQVVRLDSFAQVGKDIAALLTAEMHHQTFMTVQLELTEDQRVKLIQFVDRAVQTSVDKYIGTLNKDKRSEDLVRTVEENMRLVIDEALTAIGKEINRGAIISATAVTANSKKDDVNSIELQYGKKGGDITIPCRGIFISTNCVKTIEDSCEVIKAERGEKSSDEADKPEDEKIF